MTRRAGVLRQRVRRFKALSDGTRLKILALLAVRPCCVCELSAALELSQPTVTRHLQKLAEAGFLVFERRGFFQIYRLAPADREAENLLTLALRELSDDPEVAGLRQRLERLEVGPPFLRAPAEKPRCTDNEEEGGFAGEKP
ncbi:helix-turn-helix transcriptional regulator [Thermosulfurimonas sp. F29]|uniref:ArsR/SmtB family transcription factor n=1 Tax=Thermosulfurimonas sp. F29 TaxID=2867247 RepID=UPI001C8394CB|nr:metalloregulator ArsR/SmtB family transcription factor [Thermosulfurimonas sp. F29]MBX6422784.1 metalloregulator ArsR/SmtB family transcription factor [Thermosulfurimonas sp. F29]